MKEKLLYLLLVLMMAAPLCAQNQNAADYTIKGQVVDSLSNETVPYATLSIALASAPQNAIKLLACDDDGKFTTTLKQPVRKSSCRETFYFVRRQEEPGFRQIVYE